jgi:hypothetical protein
MATAQTEISKIESTIGVWLDSKHLVLIVLVVCLLLFGLYEFESKRAEIAEAKSSIALQQVAESENTAKKLADNNQILQAQTNAQLKQLQDTNATLQQQISNLSVQVAANNAALHQQQHTDASLEPTQLSSRWTTLVALPLPITIAKDGSFNLSQEDALVTVQQLEAIPVLTTNLANVNEELKDTSSQLSNEVQALSLEKQAHESDNTAGVAKLEASQATLQLTKNELSAAKTEATKGKFKWFGIGFVAGFITGLIH